MAWTRSATGLTFTKGSKKHPTMKIDISFKEIAAWARKNASRMPGLIWRAHGRAASTLQKRFREVMAKGGGIHDVPKFHDFEDFTKELRAATGDTAQMGGILAERNNIVKFKRDGWQIIGWPDKMESAAINFQDATGWRSGFNVDSFEKYCRVVGVRGDVPNVYQHNPRPVTDPFMDHIRRYFEAWQRGALDKMIAQELVKAKKGAA